MKIFITLAVLLAMIPGRLAALQINLTYDTNGQANSIPGSDPQGTLLMNLAQAAADHWEDIIEDDHTLNVIVRYDNGIPVGLIGQWTGTVQANGRVISGIISIRGSTPWFYDLSPTDHGEFDMNQLLYRDATLQNSTNFTGAVPGVFEIGYTGTAGLGAPPPAVNNTDLLTVLLHELGHGLGMTTALTPCNTEILDGDYDVATALVNGNVMSVLAGSGAGAHTFGVQCLMNGNIPTGRRRLPSAADVLAIATCPSPGWTDIDLQRREFLPGGTLEWTTAANWIGGKVPGFADDAFCRYGMDVPGGVLLTLSGPGICRDLLMTGSTRVRTGANKLDAARNVTIEYDGTTPMPEIFVESGGELEAIDVIVNGGDLDLSGGYVDLSDDLILSADTFGQQGNVSGYGTVDVAGTLVNNGRITATDGGTLTFVSANASPWDLDGTAGEGEVFATTGNLNFSTGAVADAFDGLLQITAPYSATFGESWTLGLGGEINLSGGSPQEAVLSGALLEADDGILRAAFRARITAPVTFGASVETLVFPDSSLRLDGAANFTGGAHLIGANSPVAFYGGGSISGGAFGLNAGSALEIRSTVMVTGGTFTGSGGIRAISPGRLRLVHETQVGVAVVNEGGIVELGPGPAFVSVESFSQNIFGTLEVVISGSPGSANYDRLIVAETASLAGKLKVTFNVPGALPGTTWQILAADNIANGFNSLEVTGMEPGEKLVMYTTASGVFLTLTSEFTYAAWAASKSLVLANNDPSDDPDGDTVLNAFEALLGGHPLVADPALEAPPTILNVGGTNYLALALHRDASVFITDLTFTAARSTNLINWSTANVTLHSKTFDDQQGHEVFLYRSLLPLTTQPKEFLRLRSQLISP
jgi:hypothetical protein